MALCRDTGTDLIFTCPHCAAEVIVAKNEIHCSIFRHGVLKGSFRQMDPHSPKETCDRLAQEGQIFGCGKPFRIVTENNVYSVESCDYL